MGMTQQYITGEVSLILGELERLATDDETSDRVARLRREAETQVGPSPALTSVLVQALQLTDGSCWDLLAQGETAAFAREAMVCHDLWQFGVCAGLLEEGPEG